MKDRKDHVDEVFKGLKSFIKDKDIFEWYKSLIVDSIDLYVAHNKTKNKAK